MNTWSPRVSSSLALVNAFVGFHRPRKVKLRSNPWTIPSKTRLHKVSGTKLLKAGHEFPFCLS